MVLGLEECLHVLLVWSQSLQDCFKVSCKGGLIDSYVGLLRVVLVVLKHLIGFVEHVGGLDLLSVLGHLDVLFLCHVGVDHPLTLLKYLTDYLLSLFEVRVGSDGFENFQESHEDIIDFYKKFVVVSREVLLDVDVDFVEVVAQVHSEVVQVRP
jgi:hypothetical protein